MNYKYIIDQVILRLKNEFAEDSAGHDWFHIERVYKNACFLQEKEGGNRELIELASLLHDISDHKFNGGKLNEGGKVAFAYLTELGCDIPMAEQVKQIIDGVSFKGLNVPDAMHTLEGKIVQDADRLDALGAIGIARAFAFGGAKNRLMYDPEVSHEIHNTFEAYAKSKSHTINHFHEKLLHLVPRLHTATAIKEGTKRTIYMEAFLKQFHAEWDLN
jgi:uncharacterized protein